MSKRNEKIYVVGHKNPDTDSICSAIAYAHLKQEVTGEEYVPRRAGRLNTETEYVLKRFGIHTPPLLDTVQLQVKDIELLQVEGVSPTVSIRDAWDQMKTEGNKTIPVLNSKELVGVISTSDIATSYMDVIDNSILSRAKTPYHTIIKTLNGKMLTGDDQDFFSKGKVQIAASDAEVMRKLIDPDDLVILGNLYESQMVAIDINVSCMVICTPRDGEEIAPEVVKRAREKGIAVIQSPYDTFSVARLINQSIPVKEYMTKMPLTTFRMLDFVDDIRDIMRQKKYREFPVLDEEGKFQGFISRRRFLLNRKKKVVLVDHNEKNQAVDGIEEADIVEIIDHHRLGNLETAAPLYFRNQPVGCTATIIYQMYEENEVTITPEIAGLLCCAIISDTLLFRSPTCTRLDESIAKRLAKIADINLEEIAQEMFTAGSNLKGKSADEICFQDFKQFKAGNNMIFGVGQISSVNPDELREARGLLEPHLPQVMKENGLQMIFFMLTDILKESTELICCGESAELKAVQAFNLPDDYDKVVLEGVVSRKKQLIPSLMNVLNE